MTAIPAVITDLVQLNHVIPGIAIEAGIPVGSSAASLLHFAADPIAAHYRRTRSCGLDDAK